MPKLFEHLAHGCHGCCFESPEQADSGIVHQHIDGAAGLQRASDALGPDDIQRSHAPCQQIFHRRHSYRTCEEGGTGKCSHFRQLLDGPLTLYEIAKDLLRRSDLPIAETAERVGYSPGPSALRSAGTLGSRHVDTHALAIGISRQEALTDSFRMGNTCTKGVRGAGLKLPRRPVVAAVT